MSCMYIYTHTTRLAASCVHAKGVALRLSCLTLRGSSAQLQMLGIAVGEVTDTQLGKLLHCQILSSRHGRA